MTRKFNFLLVLFIVGALAIQAQAVVTISQGQTAPTYSNTLNFDEPGGPTGSLPADAFLSYGITSLQAGDGNNFVGDNTAGQPWVGTGNSFFGNFGVFINFANDLTEFSVNIWDPSGPPSPIFGGLSVFVFNDGVQVADVFTEPAWGGLGDPAFNITTSGGMVFDEVRILGNGFLPTTYADDLSWNVVPEPSCGLLCGLASLLLVRFRRR